MLRETFSGAQFPVEIGLDPIETEEGSCMLASIVDVSERKLAEEKLRESEKRFRATFFQAAVGIAQTTIDGHWLLLNDRFLRSSAIHKTNCEERRLSISPTPTTAKPLSPQSARFLPVRSHRGPWRSATFARTASQFGPRCSSRW